MLYLDESGDHNLRKISPTYPIFVLGGVIVERAYVREVIEPRMREFKQRFFGRESVILHTVDMNKGRGDYTFLANPAIRTAFYAELNAVLGELDYTVIACVIKKVEHVRRHGNSAPDPYMYSLRMLVDCFCDELGEALDSGYICAEKRNPGLDRDLADAWEQLVGRGNGKQDERAAAIDARIVGFDLKDKKPDLAGMQLADLVITPIGRHMALRPAKANEVHWPVVEAKLRKVGGTYQECGLIIRP